jgi:cyclopropane-fatty-acyl-phospholipid synthase
VSTTAERLAGIVTRLTAGEPPVRIRAWDGSEAGPADGPVAVLGSRRALRRLLWSPGELGLARAFVSGDLDVDGDLSDGLRRCLRVRPQAAWSLWRELPSLLGTALRWRVLGPPPAAPRSEARLAGRLHTRGRDRDAIAHHYDLGNAFYELLLDPTMAYSCGYWTREESGTYTIADAQADKLDAVCRKLGLRPGMRHLDVGCGWGSLAVHAARHHGVQVTGITLSAQQRAFATDRVRSLGLEDRVTIRLQDYRELPADETYDSVSGLEMGEHVGQHNYPMFAAILHRALRPHGRLLLQQMSRGATAPGGGAFIERYVAPDMHMRPLGETVALLEAARLEVADVHSLREHYVWTVRSWLSTLESERARAVELIGEQRYRVWRLYLAGAALAFEENRMGVHQILAVRPAVDGSSGLPHDRADLLGTLVP